VPCSGKRRWRYCAGWRSEDWINPVGTIAFGNTAPMIGYANHGCRCRSAHIESPGLKSPGLLAWSEGEGRNFQHQGCPALVFAKSKDRTPLRGGDGPRGPRGVKTSSNATLATPRGPPETGHLPTRFSFRSEWRPRAYTALATVLNTAKRAGENVFQKLESLMGKSVLHYLASPMACAIAFYESSGSLSRSAYSLMAAALR